MQLLGAPLSPCVEGNLLVREAFECVHLASAVHESVIRKKLRTTQPDKLEGSYYSLIGHWTITPNYYHWLMDVLPMVQLMDEPSRKILIRTPRCRHERETLQELGIWDRCVSYDGDHADIEDFRFVSHPSWSVSYNPNSVRFLRNSFAHLMHPDGAPVKLFVSRRGSVREAYNEAEVEEFFRQHGWFVVNGAKLSFQEQVDLFSRATDICGVHGAGLTNTLWCREGTRVTEFLASNWMVHSNENIILINGLEYRPVVLPGGWGGRVRVPLEMLDQVLSSR